MARRRRPATSRCRVRALEVGGNMALAGGQRMNVDDRLLLLERNIGQLAAIRRPDRRNDRLGRGQRGRRALPVGIGDLQQELPA
jgi:hypothetical protein